MRQIYKKCSWKQCQALVTDASLFCLKEAIEYVILAFIITDMDIIVGANDPSQSIDKKWLEQLNVITTKLFRDFI